MEEVIKDIMNQPYLAYLSKDMRNSKIAFELHHLSNELKSLISLLEMSVKNCRNQRGIKGVEHYERTTNNLLMDLEEGKEKVDNKLRYWNRFYRGEI